MNDLLLYEIHELQNRYKIVLENTKKNIYRNDTVAVLDEINVFWSKNKRLVYSALQYLSKPYRTYVFTAAVTLDIDDYEHYPFLCIGDYHIWDDSVYSYIRMSIKTKNDKFSKSLKKQILKNIDDNIQIIENMGDKIFIFPMRMLSEVNHELLSDIVEKTFLNLFEIPLLSTKEYMKNLITIEDINLALKEDVKKYIILDEYDTNNEDFVCRFNKYKSRRNLPLPPNATDGLIFWFTLFGYFSQAIDVITSCSTYQVIPYVRYNVAFKYILLFAEQNPNDQEINSWLFKFIISHIFHKSFDKEKYSKIEINDFVGKITDNKFEKKLFNELKNNNITIKTQSIKPIVQIIKKQLELCFPDF